MKSDAEQLIKERILATMINVFIDPDTKKSGVAVYRGRKLIDVGWKEDPFIVEHLLDDTAYHIETPRIYPGVTAKDPNDLIDLAIVVGEWKRSAEAAGATVHLVYPRDAHGQRPKPQRHWDAWDRLTTDEQLLICNVGRRSPAWVREYIDAACEALAVGCNPRYGWQLSEVLDAVEHGLRHLGRM